MKPLKKVTVGMASSRRLPATALARRFVRRKKDDAWGGRSTLRLIGEDH